MGWKQLQDENRRLKAENEWLHNHLDKMNAGGQQAFADFCESLAKIDHPGDPLTTFSWLEEARFVPDEQGGHISFNGKVWRPVQ